MNVYQILRLLSLRHKFQRRNTWSREQLRDYQEQTLRDLREYVYSRSPFYRRFHQGLVKSPLAELPILTKAELMQSWDEVVTDKSVRLEQVQAFVAKLQPGKPVRRFHNRYYVVSTAGTTGLQGVFLHSHREWLTVLASYVRASDLAGLRAGVTRRRKVAALTPGTPWHASALLSGTLKGHIIRHLRLASSEPMAKIVNTLNTFQPDILWAYPTRTKLLAEEKMAGNLKISPEAIFCSSEVLTNEARRAITQAWGISPVNVYAAAETGAIASECTGHQGMHIYEDQVIVEVVDNNNQPVAPGEYGAKLLVTVLFNRTLPLIRYELGDSICLSPNLCSCGSPFTLIADIEGRNQETLYLTSKSGGVVGILPRRFIMAMKKFSVGGWQVVQEPGNQLRVRVVKPEAGFSESALVDAISSELEGRGISELKVKVEYATALEQGALGKAYIVKALR